MLWFYVFAATLCFILFLSSKKDTKKLTARLTARDSQAKQELAQSFSASISEAMRRFASKLPPNDQARKRLQKAGLQMASEEFYTYKIISAASVALFFGLFAFISPAMAFFAIVVTPIGYIFPEIWLSSAIRKRTAKIERSVPLFVDILALAVEAGLPLSTALRYVTKYLPGPLGEELKTMDHEMSTGLTRAEAMKNMSTRTGLASVNSFVISVVSAEKYGVPIKDALVDLSSQLRAIKRAALQERAGKAAVKLAIPVIFFIIIPMFIVILGPAVMGMAEVF
jgi:tight adherence protein C